MIDQELRPLKDRLLDRVARRLAAIVGPGAVTAVAVLIGLGAALAAFAGLVALSVVLWLLNRLLDGLDGAIARRRGRSTDLGGYLDIVADTVVYAAIPLGVAAALDTRAAWIAATVLLASFYVNAVSWTYLAAVLEKRGSGVASSTEVTTVRMPRGLVEGAETIVFHTALLALPQHFVLVSAGMALLVALTVVQRLVGARRLLGL